MDRSRKLTDASQPRSGTVVDARMSLGVWLRTGRGERGLSLDDVARITKIQPRILERLEAGKLDGLPAEVFVRGFVRSFAKCCGLDESEALQRYGAASAAQAAATLGAPTGVAPIAARAVVEAMADLAPRTASPSLLNKPTTTATTTAIEVVDLAPAVVDAPADPAPPEIVPEASTSVESIADSAPRAARKKKHRGKKRAQRKSMATGTPSAPLPVVSDATATETVEVESAADSTLAESAPVESAPDVVAAADPTTSDPVDQLDPVDHLDPLVEPPADDADVIATETWQPKMPPVVTTPSAPWRRPAYATSTAAIVPSLVIDDADPEGAEQVLEEREAARSVMTNAQRRSFLPPILLDREDRSARQGGLTLAVIILLIAATLTLSYLMRRPSSSGDGVTQRSIVEMKRIG